MPLSPSAFHGRWQMVRAEYSGDAAPELVVRRTVVELSATRYAVHFDGQIADSGTWELRPELGVPIVILHGKFGPNAGRTIPCIFQMVGDRLRLCYGLDETTPTAFTTKPGEARYLATYRRES